MLCVGPGCGLAGLGVVCGSFRFLELVVVFLFFVVCCVVCPCCCGDGSEPGLRCMCGLIISDTLCVGFRFLVLVRVATLFVVFFVPGVVVVASSCDFLLGGPLVSGQPSSPSCCFCSPSDGMTVAGATPRCGGRRCLSLGGFVAWPTFWFLGWGCNYFHSP